jgi:DNA polymerase-3 subunit epsilon
MKLSKTLVVLDLETTGTWIDKDKIVEIALVKRAPDGHEEIYLKKVNPGIPIPAHISRLIGITDEDVKQAPLFKDIATEVIAFLGDSDLGGFNIEKFDLPLLERELNDEGHSFPWRNHNIYDVQRVYHVNERRDLDAAYKFYCDKKLENAHSALADAEATFEILEAQVEKYGNGKGELEALGEYRYKSTAEFYDKEKKFRWWNGKLYMMFGKYARRCSLEEIVQKDRAYCEWILSANFSDEIKELIENALGGRFLQAGDTEKSRKGSA